MEIVHIILGILNAGDKVLNYKVADYITDLLIKTYNVNFNKRYFPDSLLYEQKLTTMQILLVIQPFIKNTTKIIDLIINSFCIESHQLNVRKTMQWLLIRLLTNHENCFEIIKKVLTSAISAKVSTIAAFIPVIYHIILKSNNDKWMPWMDLLLPLTMGVHFKTRVYAQTAISGLYEYAKTKKNNEFLEKNKLIYTSIQQVLRAAGDQVDKTLQEDNLFYNFDPFEDYCMEEVFPRIDEGYYKTFSSISGIRKKPREFEEVVENITEKTKDTTKQETRNIQNFQKKVTPWKDFTEEIKPVKNGDFILVATLVDKPANLGGLSRTCEVFGVKQLIVSNGNIYKDKEFRSLSMCSENWLDIIEVKEINLPTFLEDVRKNGYTVVAAEQTLESARLDSYTFPKKTVLVLG